jgi:hypothetical protein
MEKHRAARPSAISPGIILVISAEDVERNDARTLGRWTFDLIQAFNARFNGALTVVVTQEAMPLKALGLANNPIVRASLWRTEGSRARSAGGIMLASKESNFCRQHQGSLVLGAYEEHLWGVDDVQWLSDMMGRPIRGDVNASARIVKPLLDVKKFAEAVATRAQHLGFKMPSPAN